MKSLLVVFGPNIKRRDIKTEKRLSETEKDVTQDILSSLLIKNVIACVEQARVVLKKSVSNIIKAYTRIISEEEQVKRL